MRRRWLTIGVDARAPSRSPCSAWVSCSSSSFPSSDRPELIVDWNLPQNASIYDTDAQMKRFETRDARRRTGHRALFQLCRRRRQALRAVLRRAARQCRLRADRHPHQKRGGARPADRQVPRLAAQNLSGHGRLHPSARHRPAGRATRAISAERPGHPEVCDKCPRTRQCRGAKSQSRRRHLRLGRTGAGGEGQRAPGQGPRARGVLAGHRLRAQQRGQWRDASRRCATTSISSMSSRAPRAASAAPSIRCKTCNCRARTDLRAARGGRQRRFRAGAAHHLAARPPAHGDAEDQRQRRRSAGDRGAAACRRREEILRGAAARLSRSRSAARSRRAARRRGRSTRSSRSCCSSWRPS